MFQSLRQRVAREVAEWRAANAFWREHRLSRRRKWLLAVASRPLAVVSVLVLGGLGLSAITGIVPAHHWVQIPVTNFEIGDRVDYFSALWTTQSAIVALVYPIVIGFVALLIERRTRNKSLLAVYLHDSAALLAGLSSLALVGLMGLQFLALPYIGDSSLGVWVVWDGVWLLGNLVLTGYFLRRTFAFLLPRHRETTVRRYLTQVAWPEEVRGLMMRQLFRHAIANRLVDGTAWDGSNAAPAILLGQVMNVGEDCLAVRLGDRPRTLLNVRMALLSRVTRRWQERAAIPSTVGDARGDDLVSLGPVLAFPVDPLATYQGKVVLCRVDRGPALTGYESWLVRRTFVFGRAPHRLDTSVLAILTDAAAEARASLQSGEVDTFETDMEVYVRHLVDLVRASDTADDQQRPFSLAVLAGSGLMERPAYEEWLRPIYGLIDAAAARMSGEQAFVDELMSALVSLTGQTRHSAAQPLVLHSMHATSFLMSRVEVWWVEQIQNGQAFEPRCNASGRLPAPSYGVHDNVWRHFAGAWEALGKALLPRAADVADWNVLRAAEQLEEHLGLTGNLLLDCVMSGDLNGTAWATDLLLNWFENLRHGLDEHASGGVRRRSWVDFGQLRLPWTEVAAPQNEFSNDLLRQRKSVAYLATLHLWIDHGCIALYRMSSLAAANLPVDGAVAQSFAHLFSGTATKGGRSYAQHKLFANADDLLAAMLRQQFGSQKYTSSLDEQVERLSDRRRNRKDMIGGRVYSHSGADDVRSLVDGFLLVWLLAVRPNWTPSAAIRGTLEQLAASRVGGTRDIQDAFSDWRSRLTGPSHAALKERFIRLKVVVGNEFSYEEAVAPIDATLAILIDHLARRSRERLLATPIAQARLDEIATAASQSAFAAPANGFPMSRFERIEHRAEPLAREFVERFNQCNRGELTDPPLVDAPHGEGAFFSESMQHVVASAVADAAVSQLPRRRAKAYRAAMFWRIVRQFGEHARAQGQHPMLWIGNVFEPEWLGDALYPTDELPTTPPGLASHHEPGTRNPDGYQGSLGPVRVFHAYVPPGTAILLVEEALEEIIFVPRRTGFVTVSATPETQESELVDLRLAWSMAVRTRAIEAVEIRFRKLERTSRRPAP
jgi:hypothetical protein